MAPHPRIWLVIALLAVPALAGCTSAPDADVLATFYPVAFVSERLAGDEVSVALLVPEGTEPHDWSPSARDYQRIDRATLVVAQGLDFEPWLDDAIESLGSDAPLVAHSADGLEEDHAPWAGHDHDDNETAGHDETGYDQTLVRCVAERPARPATCAAVGAASAQPEDDHGHDHGDIDPHTWLDPVLFAQQVENIHAAFVQAFPEHEAAFDARADALIHELEALHEDHETGLASCAHGVIVVPHDAFGHLAERYGFRVEAVSGLDPEAEPAASRVREIIALVRGEGLPLVLSESGGDDRIMRAIAEEAEVSVRPIHTLEGRPGTARDAGHDYLDLMRENLASLQAAMECSA